MSQTTPKNNANPDVGRTKRTPVTLAIAAMGIVVVGALAWILTDDNNELAEYIKVSEKTVSVPRNPQHDADDAREGATQDVSRILNQEESDAPISSANEGQPAQTSATSALPASDGEPEPETQEQLPINEATEELPLPNTAERAEEEDPKGTVAASSETTEKNSLEGRQPNQQLKEEEARPLETAGRGEEKNPKGAVAALSKTTGTNALEGTQTGQQGERKSEEDFIPPSFDVVTVNPGGDAVLAGRAEPNTQVIVRAGGKAIGSTKSDAKGEWVFIPETPLPEGTLELDLLTMSPEGGEVNSKDVVVLLVPKRDNIQNADSDTGQTLSAEPLVVLMSREDEIPALLLQGKEPLHGLVAPESLTLDIINYDANGKVDFSGKGRPNSRISAYIDNQLVGIATVAPDGTWQLVPTEQLTPGLHTLRIDQIDHLGEVISRLETPFSMALFERPGKGEGLVVVQPGNSLWRIARRLYGRGIQYTTIFGANTDQIRDPALIYPGQIFVVPQGG